MAARSVVNKFNRGEISPLALARDDVNKIENSCELMNNFMPIRLGPMAYRPGLEYIGDAEDPTTSQNRALIPHTRSTGDSVVYEFSGTTMRPLVDGLPVAVGTDATPFTNDQMASPPATGWTLTGTAAYSGGTAILLRFGDTTYQTNPTPVTGGQKVAYETWISGAPVRLLIGDGSTAEANDLFDQILYHGAHTIQFTPATTTFTVTFMSTEATFGDGKSTSKVLYWLARSSGDVNFTVDDLDHQTLSYDTSADAMFLARGDDYSPVVIRRIGTEGSFSYERYTYLNGPYGEINISDDTITAGNATESSSFSTTSTDSDLFQTGRLLKVVFPEAVRDWSFTTTGVSTRVVGIRGVGSDRAILVSISGGGGAWKVDLERSSDQTTWTAIKSYSAATSDIITDLFDGELRYYRFNCTLYGTAQINTRIEYVSTKAFGSGEMTGGLSGSVFPVNARKSFIYDSTPHTYTSLYWYLGTWYAGTYPQGVTIYEGRVVWVSKNRVDMTVADDYYNFDRDIEGNSAAITRTIGFGPVDNIAWVESAGKLFLGLPTTEILVRSTSFDEPLTPFNTNLKSGKGVGSKAVRAVGSNQSIYHVARDGKRLFRLQHEITNDIQISTDQMTLHPTICEDGIAAVVVSQHPENRVWVLTETGELRVLLKDAAEDVLAWSRVTVDGTIEDICVVPAVGEDEIWMIVRRNGRSQIEKLSAFADIEPMDSFIRYTSPGSATLTGLTHLEGEDVGVWADSQDRGTYTVSSGAITIDSAGYTDIVVGLRYTASYKSNKLGNYISQSVIGELKRVTGTALVMRDYAPDSVQVGRDSTHLTDLPRAAAGALVTEYDDIAFGFPGTCNTDSRIYIQATGPCTIMALSYNVNAITSKKTTTDGE